MQKLLVGNTPTGVGKTIVFALGWNSGWKHPHGRGEDHQLNHKAAMSAETPPRAWGRQSFARNHECSFGNTPTGVGKTVDADLAE